MFPQYNWGYPAPLKNALDFLYAEWRGKPATTVTYGTRGGNRAAAQFHTVLDGLHMQRLDDHLEIVVTQADLDADWQLTDLDTTLSPYRGTVHQIGAQLALALKHGG